MDRRSPSVTRWICAKHAQISINRVSMLSSVRQFLLVFVSYRGSFMLVCLHQRDRPNHVACQLEDSVVNRESLGCCLHNKNPVIAVKLKTPFSFYLVSCKYAYMHGERWVD